jgi:Fic family protein
MQEWLQFFLTAVRRSADDAVARAERLVHLREQYLAEAAKARSNLPALVELIFSNPFVTAARLSGRTGLTLQGSRNVIKDAVTRGWLIEIDSRSRGGRVYWVARDVFAVIDAPWDYD